MTRVQTTATVEGNGDGATCPYCNCIWFWGCPDCPHRECRRRRFLRQSLFDELSYSDQEHDSSKGEQKPNPHKIWCWNTKRDYVCPCNSEPDNSEPDRRIWHGNQEPRVQERKPLCKKCGQHETKALGCPYCDWSPNPVEKLNYKRGLPPFCKHTKVLIPISCDSTEVVPENVITFCPECIVAWPKCQCYFCFGFSKALPLTPPKAAVKDDFRYCQGGCGDKRAASGPWTCTSCETNAYCRKNE